MGNSFCPGANIFSATPALILTACEKCGAQIELFSDEALATCFMCGNTFIQNSRYDKNTLDSLRNAKNTMRKNK